MVHFTAGIECMIKEKHSFVLYTIGLKSAVGKMNVPWNLVWLYMTLSTALLPNYLIFISLTRKNLLLIYFIRSRLEMIRVSPRTKKKNMKNLRYVTRRPIMGNAPSNIHSKLGIKQTRFLFVVVYTLYKQRGYSYMLKPWKKTSNKGTGKK